MKRCLSLVLLLGLLLPMLLVPEPVPSAAQASPSKPDGSTVAACANPNIDYAYTVTDPSPQFELVSFRLDAQSPPIHVNGYVPPPMDMSHLTGQRMPANAVLQAVPVSYDWRDNNGVTTVKDQGACGSCFAFAAVGNFEARLKVEGEGDFDFSENNAKECTYRSTSCAGGNFYDVINLFTQKGTVLEACDPYVPSDVSCKTTCPYQKTVLDWRIISGGVADTAVLKQYIYDHGPVYTAMYAGSSAMVMVGSNDVYAPTDAWGDELSAYDGSYTLYYSGSDNPNHAVLIVGWDDTLTHAGGSGGWIVKNSWGPSWGDNGYFYIAYGSAKIGTASAFVKEWQDYDSAGALWYYDEGGFGGYFGDGTTAWGLAKFLADANTSVTRVEFWTTDVTTDIDVYIYDSFDGSTLGTLLASKENFAFSEAGYHSVALDVPLAVNSGDDVVAVVKITNQSFDKPIPLDSSSPIETGHTYVSLTGASGSWTEVGQYDFDVAIRLRTGGAMAAPPTVTSITPNTGANTGSIAVSIVGGNFQTGAAVKLARSGESDINATGIVVVDATTITGNFDLAGAATGAWNVVVTNPDTQSGTLSNGFTVTFSGKTWTGAVSTDWHTSGNWDPTSIPVIGDDVLIPDVVRDPAISTADAAVNNLTINSGAVVDLTDRTLTVEGVLVNNGALKQTQDVVPDSTIEFLRITNQAGNQTKYYGVDITPQDSASFLSHGVLPLVELTLDSLPVRSATLPSGTILAPVAPVSLVVDDGAHESAYGVNDNTAMTGKQFIWLTRFTPEAATYPFTLDEIWVMFDSFGGGANVNVGDAIDLVVYEDSDGDPTNGATWLATIPVTVQAVDGTVWSVYSLSSPILLEGPGDVIIAAINRYITSGVSPRAYPATVDTTAGQDRSWIGWWSGDPPSPAVLPPDLHFELLTGESAGNWLIRGYGSNSGEAPNIEISPVSFEETLAVDEILTQTLTVSNTGTAPLTFVIDVQNEGFTPALCAPAIIKSMVSAIPARAPGLHALAWTGAASMPTARARLAGATADGCLLYAIGGSLIGSSSYFNNNEVYDPQSNSWATLASMPTARNGVGAAAVNGVIYVPGGYNGSALSLHEAYNIANNSWSSKAALPVALSGGAVVAANGKVYHIGGNTGSGYTDATYEYNPTTNTWSTKATAPEAFAYAGGAVLNGYIYIAGGWLSTSSASTRFWRYDPVGDSWIVLTSMGQGRQSPGLVAAGGYIYAFGGGVGWAALNTTEQYNPATNTWTSRPDSPLAEGRIGMATGWVRGKIWGAGGTTGSGAEDANEYLDEGYADNCGGGTPPWLSVDPATGETPAGSSLTVDVVFDATGLAAGDYTADLVITNNDPDANPVIVPALMHVVTDTTNTAPALSGLPDQWLLVNEFANNAIDLWAYASDNESSDDELTFTIDNTPDSGAGVRIDSNHYIDIFPDTDWTGQTDVVIRVTDPGGLFDTDSFRVTVTSTVNTPPTISGLPDITVPMNSTSILPLIDLWDYADDAEDSDDQLTFTMANSPDPNAGVTIDSNRYILVVPATNWVGVTDVEIQVQDTGGLTDIDVFQVTITGTVNMPPVISGLPDQTLPVDGIANNAIDLWAYASDNESPDDELTFTIDNVPNPGAGVRIDSNRYIDIFPETGWEGQTDVVVRVEDPEGLSDTASFRVTIGSGVSATSVTVAVSGNQFCANRTTGVRRCFDIDPATPISATVRFYFSEAERNGQLLEDLLVFHYDGDWTEEPGPYTRGGAGDAQYVEAQNVDDFSPFVLDSGLPPQPDHYSIYLPLVLRRWPPIPDTPVLNAISNADGDGNYTVTWNPAYLAQTYTLQEATDSVFSNATTRYTGSGTSWSASSKSTGTYYYRVRAGRSWEGQTLESAWSNVRSVQVSPPTKFYATEDASVLQGLSNYNFGNTADMWVGYGKGGCIGSTSDPGITRSLVKFNLSAVPAGSSISSARLYLRLVNWCRGTNTSPRPVTVYRTSGSWSESSVTWNNMPGLAEAYGSTAVGYPTSPTWYSFDVTNLVRGWVNGSLSNYGMTVRGPEGSGSDFAWFGFYTSESSYDPYILITYTGMAASEVETLPMPPTYDSGVEPLPGIFINTLYEDQCALFGQATCSLDAFKSLPSE